MFNDIDEHGKVSIQSNPFLFTPDLGAVANTEQRSKPGNNKNNRPVKIIKTQNTTTLWGSLGSPSSFSARYACYTIPPSQC
jgi:hypothetical protein